jgi:hypothetical protein
MNIVLRFPQVSLILIDYGYIPHYSNQKMNILLDILVMYLYLVLSR